MFFKVILITAVITSLTLKSPAQPLQVYNLLFDFESHPSGEFSFSIYTNPSDTVYMGSSTYTVEFTPGVLFNPRLTYVNPRYTLGYPGYYPMTVKMYEAQGEEKEDYISVQILHLSGQGSMVDMNTQFGEKIATVTCEIYQVTYLHLQFDEDYCFFINADPYAVLPAWWEGAYIGQSFIKEKENYSNKIINDFSSSSLLK